MVIHGLLVLVGGVLLITPGVLTDFTGLLLLLPPTRAALASVIASRVERAIRDGRIQVTSASFTQQTHHASYRPKRPQVIDVEGEPVD